jgi:adenylate cyclase
MHRVHLHPSGIDVLVPAGSTVLDAVRAAGLPLARACGAKALCGRCGVRLRAGAGHLDPESPAERRGKHRNRLEPQLRLACQARIRGDIDLTTDYW